VSAANLGTVDAVAELLLRFELGEFSGPVRARLADIFREAPTDAWERLERACKHLGVDGSRAEEVAALVYRSKS
jgi:hypothetical protein